MGRWRHPASLACEYESASGIIPEALSFRSNECRAYFSAMNGYSNACGGAKVSFIEGDITDQARFERAVVDNGITHVIHYAALQVPFVRANPVLGMHVNVVGTTITT